MSQRLTIAWRAISQRMIVTILAAVVVMVGGVHTAKASAATQAYGFSLGGEMVTPDWTSPAKLAALTGVLKSFGPKYVRVEISTNEPPAAQAAAIDAVRASGATPLVLLASLTPAFTPTVPDPTDFADFAKSVAQRFGSQVGYYEILNEQNVGLNWSGLPASPPDPVGYAKVLVAASAAIKAANPSAKILSSSPAPAADAIASESPQTWTDRVWSQPGVPEAVDIVGAHVYWMDYTTGTLRPPDTEEPSGFDAVASMKASTGKPVWVTETGFSTCVGSDNCTTEANQLAYLQSAMRLFADQGAASVVMIFRPVDQSPVNDREARFGVVHYDGTDKTAAPWVRTLMSGTGTGSGSGSLAGIFGS